MLHKPEVHPHFKDSHFQKHSNSNHVEQSGEEKKNISLWGLKKGSLVCDNDICIN